MASTIRCDIVSAEAEIFHGEAELVVATGEIGELGIAPKHAPLITRLKPGKVVVTQPNGEVLDFAISGGILEVQPTVVTVLADTAVRAQDIDEAAVASKVALADLPAPDLFIRTGGDTRVSNFLLWQLAYTELWFTETLWPEVDAATLREAFAAYASRQRRFGLTGEQVAATSIPPGGTTP